MSSKRQLLPICFALLGLLSLPNCKGSILDKMKDLQKEGKYLELAILCNEHKDEEYKEICNTAWDETGRRIDQILSQQADLPFLRVSVDQKTKKQVEEIFSKNPALKDRYLPIWKKIVQE
ncbi:hypothetical protein EHQ81_09130 [Leptospira selangorensis]|uniref:Uncharacterized protein n=1 Tax=Leptospira selangorensis TaxID=2484982 RepID=A0A4R9FYH5_9LEPT|nr:hypothetical protein [Leptospira selangorensis]TGK03695.1 hypothetical protein EHO58_14930 [Leptospira selangorensis]TGM13922.1 hypothetical protein EHQ81_09130 [Leptospira selangorensis]TGM27147.1 hypothetical protein EHQ82_03895 [Leptospira selangorensis]